MILGIDASNVRAGGGLSYFAEMMRNADPPAHGIERAIVWGSRQILEGLAPRDWLEVRNDPLLQKTHLHRLYWQFAIFPRVAQEVDVVFAPGSNAPFTTHPLVSLSQNMLPFDYREMFRFGASSMTVRYLILRASQKRSFRRSDGVIFLSQYAHDAIREQVELSAQTAIIPHGISDSFCRPPIAARKIEDCSKAAPFRFLYASIINVYKHQWTVAEAVTRLRNKGYPVEVDFVGPGYAPAVKRLEDTLQRLDPERQFLHYRGAIPDKDLHEIYHLADLFVFASSCENLPNIMIEAMSAGLPIASSRRPPMPVVLGEAGVYFDHEDIDEIARVLEALMLDPEERFALATAAYERSLPYSWQHCAERTMGFIADVCRHYRKS